MMRSANSVERCCVRSRVGGQSLVWESGHEGARVELYLAMPRRSLRSSANKTGGVPDQSVKRRVETSLGDSDTPLEPAAEAILKFLRTVF
jgi:hypothetical protein